MYIINSKVAFIIDFRKKYMVEKVQSSSSLTMFIQYNSYINIMLLVFVI